MSEQIFGRGVTIATLRHEISMIEQYVEKLAMTPAEDGERRAWLQRRIDDAMSYICCLEESIQKFDAGEKEDAA